jgi:hypothetical protein
VAGCGSCAVGAQPLSSRMKIKAQTKIRELMMALRFCEDGSHSILSKQKLPQPVEEFLLSIRTVYPNGQGV